MFKPLGGVAVIADNTWAAFQGRKKLKVDWDLGPHATYDSVTYKKELQETARKPGKVERNVGDVDAAFAKATKIIEAEYYVPHLAHAPMEPPVAVAEFKDGKVTVWAPTQNPQAVQDTVASAVGIEAGRRHLQRDAARRRLRTQVQTRLLRRGRDLVEAGRQAGEGGLEPRGRSALRLLPFRRRDVHEGRGDEKGLPTAWLGRSVYPPIGSHGDDKAELRRTRQHGLGRCAVRHCRISGQKTDRRRDTFASAGCARWPIFRTRSACTRSSMNWPRRRAAIASSTCSTSLGSDRIIELGGGRSGRGGEAAWRRSKSLPDRYGALQAASWRLAAEQSGWGKKKSGNGHGWGIAVHRSFLTLRRLGS